MDMIPHGFAGRFRPPLPKRGQNSVMRLIGLLPPRPCRDTFHIPLGRDLVKDGLQGLEQETVPSQSRDAQVEFHVQKDARLSWPAPNGVPEGQSRPLHQLDVIRLQAGRGQGRGMGLEGFSRLEKLLSLLGVHLWHGVAHVGDVPDVAFLDQTTHGFPDGGAAHAQLHGQDPVKQPVAGQDAGGGDQGLQAGIGLLHQMS